ncbi:MAG: ABC transporter permease [Gemmatimonadaceae bacterium]|nr:ABC transporter permease [Chitinophagaceae bacterium]
MFRNYFKIAWRNLWKNKTFSSINILGLAAGIAFTMLIGAYAWGEWMVNKDLKNTSNQYIVQSRWKDENLGLELTTLGPLAKALHDNYPDLVSNYYRWDGITSNVSRGEKHFREGLQVGDTTILNMYGFRLRHGNPSKAFDHPHSLVISTEKAIKYFGKTDVLGETLTIENFSGSKDGFQITGVMEKPALNSVTTLDHRNANEFFIGVKDLPYFGRDIERWDNAYIVGLVELKNGKRPEDLATPMADLVKKNAPPGIASNMQPFLVPLTDYYLNANKGLVRKMLITLGFIGGFILLMAIINFVNISISRSGSRMREIGIRKVMGSLRKQLILQFLTESVLLASVATIIALLIYHFTVPLFSSIIGRKIAGIGSFPGYFVVIPVLTAVVIGTIAGLYPAFRLSAMKSVESLKGKGASVTENVFLRKLLVGFQFATATIVFTGAMIISSQINYFFSNNLGYKKDFIISSQVPRDWSPAGVQKMHSVRDQLSTMPQVSAVTLSYEIPNGNNVQSVESYPVGTDSTNSKSLQVMVTDQHYAGTYEIPLAAGEFFFEKSGTYDSSGIVLNEQSVKTLNLGTPSTAIGKEIWMKDNSGLRSKVVVKGVTNDFHFGSMQEAIKPMMFIHPNNWPLFRFISIKLNAGDMQNQIAVIEKKWTSLMPGASFEYKFMDETLEAMYFKEIQLRRASYTATALSIVIVLLGVIGMIALNIQRRTKEIGIRKVLGASIASIIGLFMKEFVVIICIAAIVACPLAYLIMEQWLNDYAYRISLTGTPFISAVAGLAILTVVLIILQTMKAGLANPIKGLRNE